MRDEHGRFVPGTSGNPGGRPRTPLELRETVRKMLPDMLAALHVIICDESQPTAARVRAMALLLPYGYDKPAAAQKPPTDEPQFMTDRELFAEWVRQHQEREAALDNREDELNQREIELAQWEGALAKREESAAAAPADLTAAEPAAEPAAAPPDAPPPDVERRPPPRDPGALPTSAPEDRGAAPPPTSQPDLRLFSGRHRHGRPARNETGHCEGRSDEAIQPSAGNSTDFADWAPSPLDGSPRLDRHAAKWRLAMTADRPAVFQAAREVPPLIPPCSQGRF